MSPPAARPIARGRARRAGFTLVEVMLALAILSLGLVMLVRSVAGNVISAHESFYMGVATDLARGKMYDLEEQLLQEGFQETEQELEGDFSDEGWPRVTWDAVIEPTELPDFETLIGLAQAQQGGGQPVGPDGEEPDDTEQFMGAFGDSALGGMLGLMSGGMAGGSSTGDVGATAGFIQGGYSIVQQVLKNSIRKITLVVHYDTGLHKESIKTILYVTDPAGMDKVMGRMGAD